MFDDADAADITRDRSQHPFYQVIILCICAAEVYRCYAPIKKVVPPFSQHHHTGHDTISAGAQHIHPPNWKHCTVGSLPARDEWGALERNGSGPRGPARTADGRPIRLTPSDHSGCTFGSTPDPSVDSQGWYRE